MLGVCLLLAFAPYQIKAQEEPAFDELSVFIQVQNMGGVEIPAVIRDQEVLLPVSDLFNFLKIKNTLSAGMDSVSGFFLSPESQYRIDRTKNLITFQGRTYQLKSNDLVRTETNLYLLSKYFGEIFGLDCKFNHRALAVNLTTKLELPAMREMRLEEMRKNISRLNGDTRADTTIRRSRPAFHFGMADWSVISTQQIGDKTDTRINLALGSVIAGGEANVLLNYDTNEPFTEKQQYYYWRYVNNNSSFLRQTTAGKISTEATSSIYNPVVGIKLTNTPTTFRRSFGTYPLSDYTTPGWMVELYVNNVLVDYLKADASGFFSFQVPLVYGNSNVKLKFYGPWGEERSREQQIIVPFSFLPPGEVEYTVNAGMVEDSIHSIFSKGVLNYGISRGITIGTGVEYLSSVTTGTVMPFVTLATRPLSNMLLSGEYTYGVRGKGILSVQLPRNMQVELNYIKYKPGQKAVNYNYLEERKAILTLPLRGKNFSLYNRMTYDQIVLPGTGYSTAEWLISGAAYGFSTNLTNYAMFTSTNKPYVYSNLSFSFRLPRGIMFIPQAQYEYSNSELISVKAGLEKYLFRNGFLSLTYENNIKSKVQSAQFGFRYDLPFAQTGFTARQTNDQTTLMEMARGSLIVDRKTKYVGVNNRVSVGKGGIVFAPFLDLNCNNKRDNGEPKAAGLNIRISGGTATKNDRDTTVRVTDLEPYTTYLVELDANSFDNVAWKIHNKTIKIVVDPNSFKLVEIPVSVVGEVSGTVVKEKGDTQEGLGRIVVNIFNPKSLLSGKTLSEPDGYFSYLGLAPGDYEVKIDTAQLRKLHLLATPEKQSITIKKSRDGDIVEVIDFTLKSTLPAAIDTTRVVVNKISEPTQEPVQKPNTTPRQETANQNIPGKTDQIFLQVGAFRNKNNAREMANTLSAKVHYPVGVVQENGWFKVRFGAFSNSKDAELCKAVIVDNGILAKNLIKEINLPKNEGIQKVADRSTAQHTIPAPSALPATPTNVQPPVKKADVALADKTTPVQEVVVKTGNTQTGNKAVIAATNESAPEQEVVIKTDNILKRHYFVQIGAFINPKNATRVIKNITHLVSYPVGVVYRDQYYKVRYGPFETQEELNDCIRQVVKAGIMTKELMRIDYEEIGSTPAADKPHLLDGYHVQVGAFTDKANALHFFKKMSAEYPYPILIIEEDGYYKVRFGPFKATSDTKKCRKALVNNNVDCFMRSNTVKYF